jgi:hypothetical protein
LHCNGGSGAVGGKTGKTSVLPQFSSAALVVLPSLAARAAPAARLGGIEQIYSRIKQGIEIDFLQFL